ncbi:MAG: hypothetical protein PF961_23175 [Planctomycetota bacterium]|jgi:hypothetical protein|nr:hypothetical protein [Planctomycetota bacterium]
MKRALRLLIAALAVPLLGEAAILALIVGQDPQVFVILIEDGVLYEATKLTVFFGLPVTIVYALLMEFAVLMPLRRCGMWLWPLSVFISLALGTIAGAVIVFLAEYFDARACPSTGPLMVFGACVGAVMGGVLASLVDRPAGCAVTDDDA